MAGAGRRFLRRRAVYPYSPLLRQVRRRRRQPGDDQCSADALSNVFLPSLPASSSRPKSGSSTNASTWSAFSHGPSRCLLRLKDWLMISPTHGTVVGYERAARRAAVDSCVGLQVLKSVDGPVATDDAAGSATGSLWPLRLHRHPGPRPRRARSVKLEHVAMRVCAYQRAGPPPYREYAMVPINLPALVRSTGFARSVDKHVQR